MDRQRKRELRDLNARSWAGEKDVFPVSGNLDSVMKKNTAFIRRLRGPAGASVTSVLQEIRTLSLSRYLSEVIGACFEGLTKLKTPADIALGVEIFSALHQRFGPDGFTCFTAWHIGRGLSTPDKASLKALSQDLREKEEKDRLSRHRTLLKVATELWLVGALRTLDDVSRPEDAAKTKESSRPGGSGQTKSVTNGSRSTIDDSDPFPLEVLKELLGQDTQHHNLTMLASYVKSYAWDLLGRTTAGEDESSSDDSSLVDSAMQQRYRNVFVRYFEGAKDHLVRDQANINNQSRRNAEAYVRSGEIFEDRQANFEKLVKNHEKFISNMSILADALWLDMPDLKEKDTAESAQDGSIGLVKTGEYLRGADAEGPGIWADEEERRFYENLVDMKDRVPSILLEEQKKKKPDGEEQIGKKSEEPKSSENSGGPDRVEDNASKEDPTSDMSTAIANKTVGAQVDAVLARLPNIATKEAADELATEFCFLNSKASRNRLIKAVQDVPRGRADLLPLYARLVTTLGRYMPDISHNLVSLLDEEFRSLQRRKQKDTLSGVRTSNIRYLAELTKFGVVPEHVIFHCLKVSLDDFSKMNIEIICNLLENCGRYLLRCPDTSPRMKSFLETLQRKKSAQHLGQQERMLIENATYSVDPPERAAIQQKERTPLDLFLRKMIYVDLNKRNVERIVKLVRKLHWEEDEVVKILHKIFVKPYKIRYSNIHFLALILNSLNRYHPEFCASVIDDILENITIGLEQNEFQFNQRRLSEVRYFGELYVYRMIDSSVVFDIMYRIVTFGHGGWPRPGQLIQSDLPDDFFRIRLICTLLETCGMYYEKGPAKKKLEFFLTFFQYYIFTKDPMPMDIEFVVQDAYELVRPEWKLAKSLEEAGSAFAEACQNNRKNFDLVKGGEANENGDDDDELDPMEHRSPPPEGDKSSSDELEEAQDEPVASPEAASEDDEEHFVVTRREEERDPEAEEDFDRELAKMMSESIETRKVERRPIAEVTLPVRRSQRDGSSGVEGTPIDGTSPSPRTTKFSLLSKRGNKPQTRAFDLPSDSNFVRAMQSQREAEKAEQQRIKKLVLNYDLRSDDGSEPDGLLSKPTNQSLPSQSSRDGQKDANTPGSLNWGDSRGPLQNTGSGQGSRSAGGGRRHNQGQLQGRKLQLSDVNWYDESPDPFKERRNKFKGSARRHGRRK